MAPPAAAAALPAGQPSFGELFAAFLRIGLLSFGGPAGQIALMHRELVEQRRWLAEDEYLRALSFCMLLPGPEAMQLATYAGWKLHGTKGGLVAGLLFVGPGALLILALSVIYALYGQAPLAQALLLGVKAAVAAIVLHALLRGAKRAVKGAGDSLSAGLAFVSLFLLNLPFPLIIVGAALWGWIRARGAVATGLPATAPPLDETLRTAAIWGAVWLVPLAGLMLFEQGIL
ncbi:MAG: chromate transporter, partial [Cereibacter sp.]